MAEAITLRKFETKTDDNGLMTVPIDVCSPCGTYLERRSFHISTGSYCCTMRKVDLQILGYDVSQPIVLPLIRIGAFDFLKIPVEIAESNTIGVNVLKWLDYTISNTDNYFQADLIPRIRNIVEKGINPNIKLAFKSMVKPSEYNENGNWYTWQQIDALFPNSWVLLFGGDDNLDYGGEVIWASDTETPDTNQDNTFLYCNKSVATQKPFLMQAADVVRCRSYTKPDPAYSVHIEELEASLKPSKTSRFYYDVVSNQGKLFRIRNSASSDNSDTGSVLTQEAIDALFMKLIMEDGE